MTKSMVSKAFMLTAPLCTSLIFEGVHDSELSFLSTSPDPYVLFFRRNCPLDLCIHLHEAFRNFENPGTKNSGSSRIQIRRHPNLANILPGRLLSALHWPVEDESSPSRNVGSLFCNFLKRVTCVAQTQVCQPLSFSVRNHSLI